MGCESSKSECKTNHPELIETQSECIQKFPNNLILKSGCANTLDQCMQKFPNNLMAIYNCDYLAAGAAYGNADCNIFSGTDETSCNNYYSIIQGPEFEGSELAYQCVWDTGTSVCKSYNNDSPVQANICRIKTEDQ